VTGGRLKRLLALVTALAVAVFTGACAGRAAGPDRPARTEVSPTLLPVADDDGDHVGWMRSSDLATTSPDDPDAAVPVYDDDGEQIGRFRVGTDGGFEPLRP
jgi:hypothetical protein